MQTVKGRMRMYQEAQKQATAKLMRMSMRNQRMDQSALPPPEPRPPPAAILGAVSVAIDLHAIPVPVLDTFLDLETIV